MRCSACGASVEVPPKGQLGAGAHGDLELDLPAPKQAKAEGRPRPPAPAGRSEDATKPSLPELTDLPALKVAPGSKPAPTGAADDLTDLPAPKLGAGSQKATRPAKLPAVTMPPKPTAPTADADFELDLPARRAPSPATPRRVAPDFAPSKQRSSVPDLDLDLPAPRAPSAATAPRSLEPKPKSSAPDLDLDLPAPKPRAPMPGARSPHEAPHAAKRDLDLPVPKAAPSPAAPSFDLDLPAPKAAGPRAPAPFELDLPGAEPPSASAAQSFELDLPAPRSVPTPAGGGFERDLPPLKGASSPASFELDLPAPRTPTPAKSAPAAPAAPTRPAQPAVATPKKSFAKPGEPTRPAPDRAGLGALPKDSLALEPRPFFASNPPNTFGQLDDPAAPVSSTPLAGTPDLVDLPAPSDLPAAKKPQPKATALGLGGKLPRDSLDLPPTFGGDDPLPMSEPEQPFGGGPPPALSDLDLPAPRDLPAVKRPAPAATALGLGLGPPPRAAAGGGFEVQLIGSPEPAGRPPEFSLDLPPMSAQEPARKAGGPELDLGEFDGALDHLESRGGGSFGALEVDLGFADERPAPRSNIELGELEPLELPRAPSNTNAAPFGTMELAPNDILPMGTTRGGTAARRTSTNLGGELKGMLELSSSPSEAPAAGGGLADFGEIDLGLSRDSSPGGPLALAAAPATRGGTLASQPRPELIEDAELVEQSEHEAKLREDRRRRFSRRLPAWVVPVAVVGTVAVTGVALGLFTRHGYFGVYLVEQLLPAAGDPAHVAEVIAQAEQRAKSDTYGDVRKALTILSDARNEAGLNRALLIRSLLHEALYQLRFGEDAQSAQRAAAILARVLERGEHSPELAVARAADAARRGDLAEAKRFLAEAGELEDPYRHLVAGEVALLSQEPELARKAFAEAARLGAGARASWGLSRALVALEKPEEAERAARETLAESPRHAAAHTFLASRALAAGEVEAALGHVRAASGRAAIDGVPAQPSRGERARAFALEGSIEEKRDHAREAQAAYEHALAADPLSVDVLLGSGRTLMRLGRPQDALSRFDSALGAKPSATADASGRIPLLDAGLGAIEALLALERPQEALGRSSALVSQFAASPEVHLWHGHVLAALARWEDAERSFKKSIELAPKQFAGYVALSQLLFKRGRPEEAARVLARATGQVEDSAEVRRLLGYSELTRNHLPEAVQQFEAALRFDDDDRGALFGLAVAHRRRGALDVAERTLDKLAKVDPAFPGLALERGQLLENRGDYAGAIATYRKALVQRPTDTDLKLRLGAALGTAGRIDEAEGVLEQVLRERPGSAEAEHHLGRVLFARRETAQAVQRFERAVNLDATKAEHHMYLGWALLEQGNYGGALTSIERAIERDPNLGDARWLLARIQLRTGAVRDALVNLQAALRLKPGRVEALASMGDAYDELRDLPQAIKSYTEAVKRAPERAEWWYRLGQLQLDKGAKAEARSALAEAVLRGDKLADRPPWLADAHRLYADVLRESGRAPEAMDHYRTFLELAPLGHPERSEIEALVYKTRR